MEEYGRFVQALREDEMEACISAGGGCIVAYSGGADSTFLLHLMERFCRERGYWLAAAHVHHGIRGMEADRDEAFCRETAASMAIPLYVHHADVPALAAARGQGLETCARDVRYAYFRALACRLEKPALAVATAHTADDQLETVLFHLCRGSGLRGLGGIAPVRESQYIRPLLSFTGSEIRRYCQRQRWAYVEDSTNADTTYTRNRIRHCVIPALDSLGGEPRAAVGRMTALLRKDEEYLTAMAAASLSETEKNERTVSRARLAAMPYALASRVVRLLAGEENLRFSQVETILQLVKKEEGGVVPLPDGRKCRIQKDAVVFMTADAKDADSVSPAECIFRTIAGGAESLRRADGIWKMENDAGILSLYREKYVPHTEVLENIYKLSIHTNLNFATIKGVIQVRNRMPGDTIRFGGMTRRVKKLFQQQRLDACEKCTRPVLTDEEGVLWIPGFPPRDSSAAQPEQTQMLLCIEWQEKRSVRRQPEEEDIDNENGIQKENL